MIVALWAAGIATFAELYAIQGVLPSVSRSFAVDAATAALTVSMATTGLAAGVLAWAGIAMRIGRLTSMRIAIIGAVVLSVITCFVPWFEALVALRFFTGMVLGAVPVLAVAYVYERLDGPRAAVAATAYIAGTTIGGASGRLIAGPLAPAIGWRSALLVVCAVGVLSAAVFILLAPASGQKRADRSVAAGDTGARQNPGRLRLALANPLLRRLYLQSLLLTASFVAVYNFLTFRLESPPFALSAHVASLIFITYAAGTVTSRSAGRWLSRWGIRRTTFIGLVGMLVGALAMAADHLTAVIAGLIVFTGGFFWTHAAAVATTGAAADSHYRSQASALYTICFYLGSGVGGWLLGLLFVTIGWEAMTIAVLTLIAVVAASARSIE